MEWKEDCQRLIPALPKEAGRQVVGRIFLGYLAFSCVWSCSEERCRAQIYLKVKSLITWR